MEGLFDSAAQTLSRALPACATAVDGWSRDWYSIATNL
jgi:hypothetical protein